MSWRSEKTYVARIGGIIYKNVQLPIVCNGSPMLKITRSTETGELGLTFLVFNEKGEHIGNVENNKISFSDTDSYIVQIGLKRQALIDKKNGRVLCDLKFSIRPSDPEVEVVAILFSEGRFPIILHPDRSKFGKANDNTPPNISGLTLTTAENSEACAVLLEKENAVYLLGITIENFKTGISVKT